MPSLLAKLMAGDKYIAENVQACLDFKAGLISQDDMWRIINRNIKIEVGPDIQKQDKPRKGDLFINYAENERQGLVLWRSEDEVGVLYFDTKEQDSIPIESFDDYSSKGGRTKWLLY